MQLHKFIFLIFGSCATVSFASSGDSCGKVQKTNEHKPCDVVAKYDVEASPCTRLNDGLAEEITDKERCLKNPKCCWNESIKPTCFKKPVKCYVDLRPEKCFHRTSDTHNIRGIYTGYSTNGSYCFVNQIVILTEKGKKGLGYKDRAGFPITKDSDSSGICTYNWDVEVEKAENDTCNVTVKNTTYGPLDPSVSEYVGKMWFNRMCLVTRSFGVIAFQYIPNHITSQCTCRIDAWLELEDENLNISQEIKNYVTMKESQSTCTQVIGMAIRFSWLNRIALINKNEVDAVMDALTNLTHTETSLGLSLWETKVFLAMTRKVAQYSFYEGIEKNSAESLLKKTAEVMSNLIGSLSNPNQSKAEENGPALLISQSNTDDATNNNQNNLEDGSETTAIKLNLFDTVDSVSETIASRVNMLSNENEFIFRADEHYLSLSMSVAKPNDVDDLLNTTHFNNSLSSDPDTLSVPYFPESKISSSVDSVSLVSVFYEYPIPKDDVNERVSNYLSVNFNLYTDGKPERVSVPVNFTLTRISRSSQSKKFEPACSFLVPSNNSKEKWSQEGCTTYDDVNKTRCFCNHTTNFAILMKVTGSKVSGQHERVLEILSFLFGSISIICLIITVFIFFVYRRTLLKDRMIIHFHLVVALLFSYIAIFIGSIVSDPTATTPSISCFICAILMHFFYLAVFFWSLVEGIYLFYKIIMVFQRKWAEFVPIYSPIVGWLFPFIIVTISVVISKTYLRSNSEDIQEDAYVDPSTCFLNNKNHMIWAFAGPVLFIIVVNFVVLCKVSHVIYRSSYSSTKLASANETIRISTSLRRSIRGAIILLPILGTPTLIALLYNLYTDEPDEPIEYIGSVVGTTGAYLYVILSGIQGILIFFFYCISNADVRAAYKLSAKRRKSVGSLDKTYTNGRRKISRIALLFHREDTAIYSTSTQDQSKRCNRSLSNLSHRTTRSPLCLNKTGYNGIQTKPTYGRTGL